MVLFAPDEEWIASSSKLFESSSVLLASAQQSSHEACIQGVKM